MTIRSGLELLDDGSVRIAHAKDHTGKNHSGMERGNKFHPDGERANVDGRTTLITKKNKVTTNGGAPLVQVRFGLITRNDGTHGDGMPLLPGFAADTYQAFEWGWIDEQYGAWYSSPDFAGSFTPDFPNPVPGDTTPSPYAQPFPYGSFPSSLRVRESGYYKTEMFIEWDGLTLWSYNEISVWKNKDSTDEELVAIHHGDGGWDEGSAIEVQDFNPSFARDGTTFPTQFCEGLVYLKGLDTAEPDTITAYHRHSTQTSPLAPLEVDFGRWELERIAE